MSWMQKLYRTYEFVQTQGLGNEELALPFHMLKSVHLKVVLDHNGKLVDAEYLDDKKQIPIQVTEKSSIRTGSTIAAYALHDNLQYIAKTAEKYLTIEYISKIAEKKRGEKNGKNFFLVQMKEKNHLLMMKKRDIKIAFHFMKNNCLAGYYSAI